MGFIIASFVLSGLLLLLVAIVLARGAGTVGLLGVTLPAIVVGMCLFSVPLALQALLTVAVMVIGKPLKMRPRYLFSGAVAAMCVAYGIVGTNAFSELRELERSGRSIRSYRSPSGWPTKRRRQQGRATPMKCGCR